MTSEQIAKANKIEIKSIFGSVLFDYDCENNSIKKTLEEAVEIGADLKHKTLLNDKT